jgi:hypothetical protein
LGKARRREEERIHGRRRAEEEAWDILLDNRHQRELGSHGRKKAWAAVVWEKKTGSKRKWRLRCR